MFYMKISISTRWNAGRHKCGEAMIRELREIGFDSVELGYDLRRDLVEGVKRAIDSNEITVGSVHNFCPVPTIAPRGHPELFTLAHSDRRVREGAVRYTSETIRFAAEVGARAVVMHAGNVSMSRFTPKLIALAENGDQDSPLYHKTRMKLISKREKKASKYLEYLRSGLGQLAPVLKECGIKLGIENMPTWEAVPTESELDRMLNDLDAEVFGYWHDMGHAQIRENLGLSNHLRWLERLAPRLVGMHVHDVLPPARDHVMPPHGSIDFASYRDFANRDIPIVLEPTPRTPLDEVASALEYLRSVWG